MVVTEHTTVHLLLLFSALCAVRCWSPVFQVHGYKTEAVLLSQLSNHSKLPLGQPLRVQVTWHSSLGIIPDRVSS